MNTFVQNIILPRYQFWSRAHYQLAIEGKQFSQTVRMLHQNFYVVDRNKVKYDEAITIVNKIRILCAKRRFPNSRWQMTNESLTTLLHNKTDATHLRLNLDNTINTFDVYWNAKEEIFVYSIRELVFTNQFTKRNSFPK